MGRVYKALVKADRWGAGPVGRPASPERPDIGVAKDQARSPRADESVKFERGFAAPKPAPRFRAEAAQKSFVPRPAVTGRAEQKPVVEKPAAEKKVDPTASAKQVFEEPRISVSTGDLKLEARFAAFTGADAVALERYRALAIRVLNFAPSANLKSLVVTSAQSGEGKSTVAANLAWALARRAEHRVLLVEAGASAGNAAALSSIAHLGRAKCGWMDLINGSARLSEALCRIDPNGLYVISPGGQPADVAGRPAPELARALASSRGERLITELSKHFDLVVIDAPSMLESADVERLASIADATVVVARAGYTHRELVAEAIRLIPERRRCGVVLNEAETVTGQSKPESKPGRMFGQKARRTRRK
jgi:Mrp family chromosome partitioning ATPase